MRKLVIAVFLLLLTLSTAAGADVNGAWALKVEAPNGELAVTLILKQDGDKVTGTISSQMGDATVAGAVKDNDISFSMTMDANGQGLNITFKGKLSDDGKMAGSLDYGQGVLKFSGSKKP